MSGKSSRSTSPTSSNNSPGKIEIFVGNRIEAMDYMSNWYASKIAKVDRKKKKILIHFEGWNQRYDEWVPFDSKKVRPLPKEKEKSNSKPKEYKEWKEDDNVSAKWTDGTYYPAKIVKVISKDFYEVEYDDGFQKIVHQSKIRDKDSAFRRKKPSSLTSKTICKEKLAEDRASRARRRSDKDKSSLTSPSSENTENKHEGQEQGDEVKTESSRKRRRRDSSTSEESKRAKTDLSPQDDENAGKIKSTSEPSKDVEATSEGTSKVSEKSKICDESLSSTNTIRVTHIKETAKDSSLIKKSTKTKSSKTTVDHADVAKRSVTSPLSVEVEPSTDIHKVIIPDKDMKMLQSTGVLSLLNVQEPCVIADNSLTKDTSSTSAAEEVLSKCKTSVKIKTEMVETVGSKPTHYEENDRQKRSKKVQEKKFKDIGVLGRTEKPHVPRGTCLDSTGDIVTSEGAQLDKSATASAKDVTSHFEKSLQRSKCDQKQTKEELSAHADTSSSKVHRKGDMREPTEHAQKYDETKDKPGDKFKAKRMRLDQITGKLSIQRQTQITAKREVIKQKLDHLKSEEIIKCSHVSTSVPPTYQQISPNPTSPYSRVSTSAPRITHQYVERYPAPTLLTYSASTQCSGPCCTYPPGNSYPPVSSCGYQVSPGGLPPEAYVVYGPGTQTSFPVLAPTVGHPQCSCCQLYPTAVLHESGQSGSPLVRIMHVDQRRSPLPGSVMYTQTTSQQGERAKGSPRGKSPEGRKVVRVSKKAEQEIRHSCKLAGVDSKHGIRAEESKPKTSNKSSNDSKTTHPQHKSAHNMPTHPSTSPNAPDVNLSKHFTAHLTSPQDPKRPPPTHLALDPDDIPLSRLVTPGENTLDTKVPVSKTPLSTPSDAPTCEQLMSTPLPADGYPGKVPPRPHVFAPKELRIELDHNKFKCEYPECDKSFRKATLLDAHVKYYHTSSRLDQKRKRSSASFSEDDSFEHPKRRIKRQSTSDVSIGSVGDFSVEAHSPTVSEPHVEVEHDLDDDTDADISEQKDEDVVRCLCDMHEDSGLMIQCEQCYTWQHSDCVNVGEEHVPTKYICYVCKDPPGLRKNARYKNNYDWFKTGILPSFVPRDNDEVKIVQAQSTHCLLSDLHTLNSELNGVSRKIHILRTPNHSDLKLWEHKHDVCEDDSLESEGDAIKNESNLSEAPEMNEDCSKEENVSGSKLQHDGTSTCNETTTLFTPETRGNDIFVGDKELSETKSGRGDELQESNMRVDLSSASVQDGKSHDDSARFGINGAREHAKTTRVANDTTRLNKNEARDEESTRSYGKHARDVTELARENDIGAGKEVNLARDGIDSAPNTEFNEKFIVTNNHVDGRIDEKNTMKYSGEDLAFVNLLQEIEEDQTFYDKQLDRLEKQVEILEKSFTVGINERKTSIRKLAKQLAKLQKLGFVC